MSKQHVSNQELYNHINSIGLSGNEEKQDHELGENDLDPTLI